ncbi:MAG: hypothetical protein NTZ18_03705 [Candidatus Komeilibacteria bacterium]|nr:hypothetical protein [Candidatus Komeilibacteria bacterium]
MMKRFIYKDKKTGNRVLSNEQLDSKRFELLKDTGLRAGLKTGKIIQK